MSYAPRRVAQGQGPDRVAVARTIAGLIWLVLVGTVLIWELSAYFGYTGAHGKLDRVLAREEGGLMPRADVENLIGKQPDGPPRDVGGEYRATYTWRGLFRTHTLVLYFTRGRNPHLLRLGEADDAPPRPA